MKKSFLTIILICLVSISNGQKFSKKADIYWGPKQKKEKKLVVDKVIANDDSGIYTINYLYKGFIIGNVSVVLEKYNDKFIKTGSNVLNLKDKNGKKRDIEGFIYYDDKIYMLSSFKNKKIKKNYLFVQSINNRHRFCNNVGCPGFVIT